MPQPPTLTNTSMFYEAFFNLRIHPLFPNMIVHEYKCGDPQKPKIKQDPENIVDDYDDGSIEGK
jgi:hypothetical protein